MITKTLEYAIAALQFINSGQNGELYCRKEIAKGMGMKDFKYLGVVLQKLAIAGLARSFIGAEGGYRSTPAGRDATLADVMASIDSFPDSQLGRMAREQLDHIRIDSIPMED
jgi:DNA-binding IscR family transcriptional regulator